MVFPSMVFMVINSIEPESRFFLFVGRVLQPPAPAVLPENPGQVVIAPRTGLYRGASEKLDRIVAVHRQRQCGANPRIFLYIIVWHIVYSFAPAVIVRTAQCCPNATTKVVGGVDLRRVDRILIKGLAAKKIVITAEKEYTG